MPDIPTSAEAGLPDFQMVTWFGLFGPAGMPAELVSLLNAALAESSAKQRLASLGLQPVPSSPAEAMAYLQADADKSTSVIHRVGLVIE